LVIVFPEDMDVQGYGDDNKEWLTPSKKDKATTKSAAKLLQEDSEDENDSSDDVRIRNCRKKII
jgi:hypothetical protein